MCVCVCVCIQVYMKYTIHRKIFVLVSYNQNL